MVDIRKKPPLVVAGYQTRQTPQLKTIPKHSSCFCPADYAPYFGSLFRHGCGPTTLENVWKHLLPDRRLFATPSGRHALWYFLTLANLQPGDEVLVPAYNFYAIVRLLEQKGLVPVFVDIEPDTLCLDPQDLAARITSRSRLVIVCHMFGHPADLSSVMTICQRHNLLLFEDCAHAIGTWCQQKHVGQAGDGALFSFGIMKLLNTFGGGMLTLSEHWAAAYQDPVYPGSAISSFFRTFSRVLLSFLMTPRVYGWFLHPMTRLTSMLAEAGWSSLYSVVPSTRHLSLYTFTLASRAPFKPFMLPMCERQLVHLEENIAQRKTCVDAIKADLLSIDEIGLLNEDRHGCANRSYFGIYVPDPEALAGHLEQCGIATCAHEFNNCAALPQFAAYQTNCPHAHYAAAHLLRLPSYPELSNSQVRQIVTAIKTFFQKG